MWSLVIGLVMLQGKQHVESRDGTGHVAGRKSMRRFEKFAVGHVAGGSCMWSLVSLFSFVIGTLHLFQVVSVGDSLRKC